MTRIFVRSFFWKL